MADVKIYHIPAASNAAFTDPDAPTEAERAPFLIFSGDAGVVQRLSSSGSGIMLGPNDRVYAIASEADAVVITPYGVTADIAAVRSAAV